MRSRAKEILPNVLLTLLSIIQALALELLWSKLQQQAFVFESNMASILFWLQAAASFLGILVIWIIYATNVMRFRWVPGISDSVVPFIVGLFQFAMIESLGHGSVGWWFLCLAVIFGLMHGISQLTMRRARQDGENSAFFDNVAPATLRDFLWPVAAMTGMVAFGVYVQLATPPLLVPLVGVIAALTLLGYQLLSVTHFWNRAMTAEMAAETSSEQPPDKGVSPDD